MYSSERIQPEVNPLSQVIAKVTQEKNLSFATVYKEQTAQKLISEILLRGIMVTCLKGQITYLGA